MNRSVLLSRAWKTQTNWRWAARTTKWTLNGELLNAYEGFKENKTPGEDGFTKEFYETFFDLIGDHLLDSYNEAFDKGKMSTS